MGGSLSEPLTLLDLSERVLMLHSSKRFQYHVGWKCDGKHIPMRDRDDSPAHRLVDGMQHVDDALVFSYVFCSTCLHKGVCRMWPRDVGAKLEASGLEIPFLHVSIFVDKGSHVFDVRPTVINREFVEGISPFPEQSRVAPCIDPKITTRHVLRSIVLGKLVTFNQIADGRPLRAAEATAAFLVESHLLMWPLRTIGHVLTAIPRRHSSLFFTGLRLLGKILRHLHSDTCFDFSSVHSAVVLCIKRAECSPLRGF